MCLPDSGFMTEIHALVRSIRYWTSLRKVSRWSTHAPKYYNTATHPRASPWTCSRIPWTSDLGTIALNLATKIFSPILQHSSDSRSRQRCALPITCLPVELMGRSSAESLHPSMNCKSRRENIRAFKWAELRALSWMTTPGASRSSHVPCQKLTLGSFPNEGLQNGKRTCQFKGLPRSETVIRNAFT